MSSGGSLASLQRPNRIVICATKAGTEKNATVFARYWVEALRDSAADTDKNDIITALEAFRYAEQKTSKFYESQKRLATEHAVLEDTGSGDGTKAPSAQNGQAFMCLILRRYLSSCVQQVNDFLHAPDVIRDARFHRRRHAETLMQVVMHEV